MTTRSEKTTPEETARAQSTAKRARALYEQVTAQSAKARITRSRRALFTDVVREVDPMMDRLSVLAAQASQAEARVTAENPAAITEAKNIRAQIERTAEKIIEKLQPFAASSETGTA